MVVAFYDFLLKLDIKYILLFFSPTDLGSSFWGMVLILASTKLLTAKIAAGCFIAALVVVLFIAKNVRNYNTGLCRCF